MNAIANRIANVPAANADELALFIKREAPTLANLDSEQLQQVAKAVLAQRLTSELNAKVDIASIDWIKEREAFLKDTRSEHTRRAYTAAMCKLEAWANREGINPLELTTAGADQFIRSLKDEHRAAASMRRDIAAVSAFYTWLERYHSAIKNPIRGTRLRPQNEAKKETVIPTAKDYKTIIDALPAVERAMILAMALRGLRAGALPTLELKRGKYHGKSKGKALLENNTQGITLPRPVLSAIANAGLNEKKPFAWETRQRGKTTGEFTANSAGAIEKRIAYHINKLYSAGKIAACYSCHDFRHYFAVQEYNKNKDIFRLSKLLNHASIQITQIYLKSLGIEL